MAESILQNPEEVSYTAEQIVADSEVISLAVSGAISEVLRSDDAEARAEAARNLAIIGSNALASAYLLVASPNVANQRPKLESNDDVQALLETLRQTAGRIEQVQVTQTEEGAGENKEIDEFSFQRSAKSPIDELLFLVPKGARRPSSQKSAELCIDAYQTQTHASNLLVAEILKQNPGLQASSKFCTVLDESLKIVADYEK